MCCDVVHETCFLTRFIQQPNNILQKLSLPKKHLNPFYIFTILTAPTFSYTTTRIVWTFQKRAWPKYTCFTHGANNSVIQETVGFLVKISTRQDSNTPAFKDQAKEGGVLN